MEYDAIKDYCLLTWLRTGTERSGRERELSGTVRNGNGQERERERSGTGTDTEWNGTGTVENGTGTERKGT